MIPIAGALSTLRLDLREVAGRERPATLAAAWPAYERFAQRRFETPEDGILVQFGPRSRAEPEQFSFSIVRQLESVEDPEHPGLEQLSLEFTYSTDDALRSLGSGNGWWFRGEPTPVEDFLAEWSRSPAARAVWDAEPLTVTSTHFQV